MHREQLEKYQVLIYLAAIGGGLLLGLQRASAMPLLEFALWPVLALLLYATFSQSPLIKLRAAAFNIRFLVPALVGNFVLIPLVVYGMTRVGPGDDALRLGVLLVLLVPCTDWFITFSHLGRAHVAQAIALSPFALLLQLLLLPLYLFAFEGDGFSKALGESNVVAAFVLFVGIPLLAAFCTEKWVAKRSERQAFLGVLAWFPVPLLALVVFGIAATQVTLVQASLPDLGQLTLIFAAFLMIALVLAKILAILFRLAAPEGRLLAFSFGTRNSFVVLPIALALPPAYEIAVVAVVFQSIVELFGMVLFVWLVPQLVFPDPPSDASP